MGCVGGLECGVVFCFCGGEVVVVEEFLDSVVVCGYVYCVGL